MKEWLENTAVKKLLSIRRTLLDLTDEECRDERDVYMAIAEGRILHVFASHPERDLPIEGFRAIEYDPVVDWASDGEETFPSFEGRTRSLRGKYPRCSAAPSDGRPRTISSSALPL